MSYSNYSNLPTVVELRGVRDRNEFRWKRMGKVARLPWSFKPEQARGVCIFRTHDEGCGQIVWQIGIGHCDTKTMPKRLIISDVDGEHIQVISPKDYISYPQFLNFADAKAAFSVGSAGIKGLWQTKPCADSLEQSDWTSDFHDCEILDVNDSDESFLCKFENEIDPDDRCRWVPFPCLFSLPAFEKHIQKRFPSQGQPSSGAPSSSESKSNFDAAPKSDAAEVLTGSSTAISSSLSAAFPGPLSTIHTRTDVTLGISSPPVVASGVSPAAAPSPVSPAPMSFPSLSSIVSHLSQRYILFVPPVNPKHFPGYSKVVKNPMSLSVITSKIAKQGSAYSAQALWQDIQLMCNNCRDYWIHKDPMIVSQADALQAEASTKLKGILADATVVSSATVQAAATAAETSLASAAIIRHKEELTAAEGSSSKRPRDVSDERALKKQTPTYFGDPKPDTQKKASLNPSSSNQSAQITGNLAVCSSNAPSSVFEVTTTGPVLVSLSATKVTETSVSSLEGDRTEAEDVQAKLQAELAWYRQQIAEKERREIVETEKMAERKVYASKYAAELLGQTLYVQPLQPLPGVTREEHSKMMAVECNIWLPCEDDLMRRLQQTDSGGGGNCIPQFAPWW